MVREIFRQDWYRTFPYQTRVTCLENIHVFKAMNLKELIFHVHLWNEKEYIENGSWKIEPFHVYEDHIEPIKVVLADGSVFEGGQP